MNRFTVYFMKRQKSKKLQNFFFTPGKHDGFQRSRQNKKGKNTRHKAVKLEQGELITDACVSVFHVAVEVDLFLYFLWSN